MKNAQRKPELTEAMKAELTAIAERGEDGTVRYSKCAMSPALRARCDEIDAWETENPFEGIL